MADTGAALTVEEIETRAADLDDRLWERVLTLVLSDWPRSVFELAPDVQAYYVTRLFEWAIEWDGPDAFWNEHAALIPLVGEGYRRLGLDAAAAAFDRLSSNRVVERLTNDGTYVPAYGELKQVRDLVQAVGWHQEDRLDFVISRATSFCF